MSDFEVRDIQGAHAHLCDLDLTIQSPPVEFENSWAFVLHDPDGHPIELIQWNPDVQPYRAGSAVANPTS